MAGHQSNFQRRQFELQKRSFKLEVSKVVATIIGVVATLSTVYLGISKYVDEKENERTAAYREALYRIFSEDINDNKIGLKDIVRYEARYPESVPILVNVLLTMDEQKFTNLKSHYCLSAVTIGKTFYPLLGEYLQLRTMEIDSAETSRQRIQWLLTEFIKVNNNVRDRITLSQIAMSNADLSNRRIVGLNFQSSVFDGIVFDNSILASCDFSNSVFRHCSFWSAQFSKSVVLDNARFEDCNFLNGSIRSSIRNTVFGSCNVLGLQVSVFPRDNFQGCEGDSTVRVIKD